MYAHTVHFVTYKHVTQIVMLAAFKCSYSNTVIVDKVASGMLNKTPGVYNSAKPKGSANKSSDINKGQEVCE